MFERHGEANITEAFPFVRLPAGFWVSQAHWIGKPDAILGLIGKLLTAGFLHVLASDLQPTGKHRSQ